MRVCVIRRPVGKDCLFSTFIKHTSCFCSLCYCFQCLILDTSQFWLLNFYHGYTNCITDCRQNLLKPNYIYRNWEQYIGQTDSWPLFIHWELKSLAECTVIFTRLSHVYTGARDTSDMTHSARSAAESEVNDVIVSLNVQQFVVMQTWDRRLGARCSVMSELRQAWKTV